MCVPLHCVSLHNFTAIKISHSISCGRETVLDPRRVYSFLVWETGNWKLKIAQQFIASYSDPTDSSS